ncbi:Bax inhibitor-1/YccA family protein [Candidatus Peregrinibacteria bacterium]|nr:Bax inhibitor-1/YccA family protein [Candidatus Peregrinibacteria bacterium]
MPLTRSHSSSAPITLSASTQFQTYLLFALAMALTVVGVGAGIAFAPVLLTTGVHILFFIVEMGIILSAPFWVERSPLNYLLFGLFPLLSGITFTPYVMMILLEYVNGAEILLNALIATTFMALAAAVFARIAPSLEGLARGLLLALLGILFFMIAQIFFPSLRTGTAELFISGIGIVVFALFTALDLQRVQRMGSLGISPFLLALRLYLDIFNLFLFVLRFMSAFGGQRR